MEAFRTVRVTNVAFGVTKEILQKLLSHIGTVESVSIYPAPKLGEGVQEAQATFENAEDAELSLHLVGTMLVGRKLMIQPVIDEPLPINPAPAQPQVPLAQPTAPAKPQIILTSTAPAGMVKVVEVCNLPAELTEAYMGRVLFANLKIKGTRVIPAGMQGSGSGRTFVIEFATFDDAKLAVAQNGHMFNGQPLLVRYSSFTLEDVDRAMQAANASSVKQQEQKAAVKQQESRKRSRSRERRRSRSRSRERRRSRSRDYYRRRSRSRDRYRREREHRHRSPRRYRSRSRSRERQRSRERKSYHR